MPRFQGTYTALVTPFAPDGSLDARRFDTLLEFQSRAHIDGVVVGGTTAESPTLSAEELLRLVGRALERLPSRVEVVAGAGRNDLTTSRALVRACADLGVRAVMLVDPAYNAPSSLEIRREYLQPLASSFPDLAFLSYVIPARTGTRLHPVDLELAVRSCPNLAGIKDACGDDEYSREVRRREPPPFSLLAGDDGRIVSMIEDPAIRADGAVSVIANLTPDLVRRAVSAAREGDREALASTRPSLQRLAQLVSYQVDERSSVGTVPVKVRNPVPVKAAFGLLGAGLGACRPPLGRLGPSGFDHLYDALRAVDDLRPSPFEELRRNWPDVPSELLDRSVARSAWSYDGY